MPPVEPHLILAFALASSPGAYTVLLGAGMSIGAGVPTAWGVQQDLIARIARASGEQAPADLDTWYVKTYGHAPSYDHLLEQLAPSPHTRQALLRAYFEPPDEPVRPSPAHVAVARLVASGHVRVVLTTNFDRLLEAALRAEGIEPTVVTSVADIAGLAPLHLLRCLVVHVHGDYLTPAAMLNTPAELSAYDPALDALLDRILDDHGLLIVGWSAMWDVALRTALSRRVNHRFPTYWVDPATLGDQAQELASRLAAERCQATADEFFGQLADAVQAARDTSADPRSLPTAIAAAKRELAGGRVAIPLHDRLRRAHDTVLETAIRLSDTRTQKSPQLRELEDTCQLYLGLVATTAYWGTPATDGWWLPDLPRLAEHARGSGSTAVLTIRHLPAMYVLHAAGVAAVAAERWGTLARLFDEHLIYRDIQVGTDRPVFTMSPGILGIKRASAKVHQLLADIFTDHLALGPHAYADAWERFEYLRLLASTDWGYRTGGGWGSDVPHIRADGRVDHHVPVPAAWVATSINAADHPLLKAGAFAGDYANFIAAVTRYNEAFGSMATQAAWSTLQGRAGTLPSEAFYPGDTPQWR